MAAYRFFFVRALGTHVTADIDRDVNTDAAAEVAARELLARSPKERVVEVWDGARFVCQVVRENGGP